MECNGCTLCCQWGKFGKNLAPNDPFIKIGPNGSCIHLIKRGCLYHNTVLKPKV